MTDAPYNDVHNGGTDVVAGAFDAVATAGAAEGSAITSRASGVPRVARAGSGREQIGLVVDGGATQLRMGVVDPAASRGWQSVVRQVEVPGFQWVAGEDPVQQQRDRVTVAWNELGRPAPISVLALGLAGGAADPASRQRLAPQLAAALGAEQVLLTGDAVTTHLGALGGAPGVVVSAGTGVACLAVTAEGEVGNVDGLGYLFGDVGGGYWLGRAGIQAALDALEREGPTTQLVVELEEWIRAYVPPERAEEPLRERVKVLYAAPNLVAEIASFGSRVAATAAVDEVADGLCRRAGAELGRTAASAVHAHFPDATADSVQVSWAGSLLRSAAPVYAGFVDELDRLSPSAVLTQPDGDALRGAALLATRCDVPHVSAVVRHEHGGLR